MVSAYIKTLGRPPGHLLWLLLLVALTDLGITYSVLGVRLESAWERAVILNALPAFRWIPLAWFVVAVNTELLLQANVVVATRGWLPGVAVLAFISYVSLMPLYFVRFLNVPGRGFIVAGGSFLVYGWFCVCVLCVIAGCPIGRSISSGMTFVARHLGKVLAYLILVCLFYFVSSLVVLGLVVALFGPINWQSVLVGFLGAFFPSVLSPLLATIFTKVQYFEDAPIPRPGAR
jgi:hypothetical protein